MTNRGLHERPETTSVEHCHGIYDMINIDDKRAACANAVRQPHQAVLSHSTFIRVVTDVCVRSCRLANRRLHSKAFTPGPATRHATAWATTPQNVPCPLVC